MIRDSLAVIGFIWVGVQARRFINWCFFTNRDGNSGRYNHWDDDAKS